MAFEWIPERSAKWDADKKRVIGDAAAGIFDRRFSECSDGDVLPGEWWRVEEDGTVVGFGWLDLVWGDAEVTLAADPGAKGRGVGTFILEQLEAEAQRMGVHRVYNTVRSNHPERDHVTAWLTKRGFELSEDGSLFRRTSKVRT